MERDPRRPKDYPILTDYEPTRFMAEGSHYDEELADFAVNFIELLPHTQGEWEGKRFWLLPWQERIIRDIFGTVQADGMRQFKTAYIEIPKKNGKELHVSTPIPTPRGWETMGSLKVGDEVFGDDGRPCRVVAKSEVDVNEDAYRITFRDGSEIVAGQRHQWAVDYINGKPKSGLIMTTEEIFEKWNSPACQNDGGRSPVRIKVGKPFSLEDADLPVDPYLMGVWLGDGWTAEKRICAYEEDMEYIFGAIPYKPIRTYKNGAGASWVAWYEELERMVLPRGKEKYVPMEFLRASERQRWELLAGIIDSDGHISETKGQAIINGTCKTLMNGIRELLWSLGIKNSMTEEASVCHGEYTGQTLYIIRFVAFDDMPISKIPRYLARRRHRNGDTRNNYHYISKMENLGNGIPMQCIQVDSPSHCYLAGLSMVPTHNSELAAAIALYLLYADGENSPIVFSAAADREQAGIVYKVAAKMVKLTPDLENMSRVMDSTKRIVCYQNGGYYTVASSDVGGKHGFSISGLVFDELHTQPNRELWDVLTKGSGDARRQPLHVAITTAGNNRQSICYEIHNKAVDILDGRRTDPTFYPVVYSLSTEDDWSDEENWYKCNPSLGHTIRIDAMRTAFAQAQENPAEEAVFRQLRLDQWVGSSVAWIPDHILKKGEEPFSPDALAGRECYGAFDLSSSDDISAFVLVFPPDDESGKYIILPYFWVPEDTVPLRVRRTSFPYDIWIARGFMASTPGNIIDYGYIEAAILDACRKYDVKEIAYDPWHAQHLVMDLADEGKEMVETRQGWKTMSPPSKEFYELMMKGRISFGGNPVFKWMCQNVVIEKDPAGNIKPSKNKSKEKIDGVVAAIMALDRALRREVHHSVYDDRGLLVIY